MKEIAHSYIAEKVTGKKHPDLYIGSLLPDLVPYTVATELFPKSEDETNLHGKGAENFLNYLRRKKPQEIFLAIGMLAHGAFYGADRYNDVEYQGGPVMPIKKERKN